MAAEACPSGASLLRRLQWHVLELPDDNPSMEALTNAPADLHSLHALDLGLEELDAEQGDLQTPLQLRLIGDFASGLGGGIPQLHVTGVHLEVDNRKGHVARLNAILIAGLIGLPAGPPWTLRTQAPPL